MGTDKICEVASGADLREINLNGTTRLEIEFWSDLEERRSRPSSDEP